MARAVMSSPELLLLDEPASGLDLPGREALLSAVRAIGDGRPLTTLIATHHFEEIPPNATHALLIGSGVPVASGPIIETLTSRAASECFRFPIEVACNGGRWSAVASTAP